MPSNKEQISQIEELLEELVANPEDISISETAKKIHELMEKEYEREGIKDGDL